MVIGIMGGVGSGKSTVLEYLESQYDACVIQSDLVAREIMTKGHEVCRLVLEEFPDVNNNGNIDRDKLAEIVFHDEEKLKKLNHITHPGTIIEIQKRIKECSDSIIVVESALLIGSGIENDCDELWFIYCEKEERIARLIQSRGYSRQKAMDIINSQPSDEDYNFYADEFIDNTGSSEKTKEQIDLILTKEIC